jgi:hypothetical protein
MIRKPERGVIEEFIAFAQFLFSILCGWTGDHWLSNGEHALL